MIEVTLRKLYFALPAAMISVVIFSTPVLATDTRTAIGMCDKNPNCNLHSGNDGNNITMCMTGGPSKGQCVSCPAINGQCNVVGAAAPGRKGKGSPVGTVGVLQPPSQGNPGNPPPKVNPVSTTGTMKGTNSNQTGSNQPVVMERAGNMQHSGGGGHK